MAKTNFSYEKRQRELEKKKKAEEKARKKAEAKLRGEPEAVEESDTREETQEEQGQA